MSTVVAVEYCYFVETYLHLQLYSLRFNTTFFGYMIKDYLPREKTMNSTQFHKKKNNLFSFHKK